MEIGCRYAATAAVEVCTLLGCVVAAEYDAYGSQPYLSLTDGFWLASVLHDASARRPWPLHSLLVLSATETHVSYREGCCQQSGSHSCDSNYC